MNIERCKNIVSAIQTLGTTQTEELFKLLHKNKCEYTRNNNGVFVNLSWLSDEMLSKIETYVAFCNKSQIEVRKYESLCDVLNKNIQEYKTEEPTPVVDQRILYNDTYNKPDKRVTSNKVSSSMKFYLLKKRFSKQNPAACHMKSDLKIEEYVM
mgnify:CR=1 FL=1